MNIPNKLTKICIHSYHPKTSPAQSKPMPHLATVCRSSTMSLPVPIKTFSTTQHPFLQWCVHAERTHPTFLVVFFCQYLHTFGKHVSLTAYLVDPN